MVKNLPTIQETWVCSLGWEDPLQKGMATHSNILENSMSRGTWWASPWGLKESDMTDCLHFLSFLLEKES